MDELIDDQAQVPVKCRRGEEHDIENIMQDRYHTVYQCVMCGLRMEFPRNLTVEDIIGGVEDA